MSETAALPTLGWPDSAQAGRVWTARYANPRIAASGLAPVRITVGHPRFALRYPLAASYAPLAPQRSTLTGLTPERFAELYCARLDATGVDAMRSFFDRLRADLGADPLLLCFEDVRQPDVWCHRRLFAAWWQRHTGEPVLELAEGAP